MEYFEASNDYMFNIFQTCHPHYIYIESLLMEESAQHQIAMSLTPSLSVICILDDQLHVIAIFVYTFEIVCEERGW